MPHQRGEPPLGSFGAHGHSMRDGREAIPHSMHPVDFQRRRLAPMVVHHASPGGRHLYASPHPHSPAWYGGSVAGSPHRVPGSSLSVASGESLVEEHILKKAEEAEVAPTPAKTPEDDLREKQELIHEALRRHIDDDENSIGTNEADAASALLFATGALRRATSSKVSVAESKGEEADTKGTETASEEHKEEAGSTPQGEGREKEEPAESSGPLKKRRKLLDFLRKKPVNTATTDKPPLHVSPLPSPKVGRGVASHEFSETPGTATTGASTSESPARTTGSSSTCMASSYDMKDMQCLHEGAKIKDAAEISPPPAQVVIQHFPTILHEVLSSAEKSGNVIQWLPDGKAWKIVRWDALRRQILPKHFAHLEDEDGKVGASIDAFLWHLSAWGFEEVQSGPDAGAYSHEFFCKDLPDLCHKMKFAPKQSELESPTTAKKTSVAVADKLKEAAQPRSILQVPSLASAPSRSDAEGGLKEAEQAFKWREEQQKNRMIHSPTILYQAMAGRPLRHPNAPVFVNYRMEDVAYAADAWQYFPESPMGMRHLGPGLTSYEQQLIQQNYEFVGPRTLALHNTPRVQSGRGGLRLGAIGKVGAVKQERPVIRRPSFPVSNRGKGSRGGGAVRVIAPPSEAMPSGSAADDSLEKQDKAEESAALQKASEEVAERVAVAISKKTKRKLPLSSSSSASTEQGEEEDAKKPGVSGV